ncbi:MAG: O-antigen ligase family protein [Candidatus Brocadiia bacterium]
MIERIPRFFGQIIEAVWLMALVIIPLFFNPYSSRIFEADKTYILISVFFLLSAFMVVSRIAHEPRPIPNKGFVWLAIGFGIVYWISSALALAPETSFGGFYLREEGWLTLVSYIFIFLVIVYHLKSSDQIKRLVTTAILTGLVVALYGLFQRFGIDTVPWASNVASRVTTTFGNPIFAGAYLIMVIPLALARLIGHIKLRQMPQIMVYSLVLIIQAWCVVATQSRGPFIGLVAGIFFFAVLYGIINGYRKLIISTAVVVVLIGIFAVLLNINNSPLDPVKTYLGRLGEMTQSETGSGKVRLLIWEGAVAILKAEPARIFFGYGLESMFPLYHKYTPASFARYEGSLAVPDHSHNDTFDVLITGGAVGLLVYLGIFALIIYLSLRRLEIIRQSPARFRMICLAGILAGLLVPYAITGRMIFLGLGIPFGLLAAIGGWLLLIGFRNPASDNPKPTVNNAVLIIALLAGIIGHFAEIQFGIGVTSTRLYLWVYLALLAILSADTKQEQTDDKTDASPARNYMLFGLIIGLVISIFIFELVKRKFLIEGMPFNFYYIAGTIWALAGLFVVMVHPPKRQGHETGLGTYFNYYVLILLGSGLVAGIFYMVYTSLLGDSTVLAGLINSTYLWFNIILVSIALLLPNPEMRPTKGYGWLMALVLILPAFYWSIYLVNLRNIYADMYCRQAENLEKINKFDEAISNYAKAIELAPKVDYFYSSSALARTYQKAGRYEDASKTLQKARTINPLNPFHVSAIARLYSDWAEQQFKNKPDEYSSKLNTSLKYYDQLAVITPNSPQVEREQGDVYRQMGNYPEAIARYKAALAKDDRVGLTWLVLGKAYQQNNIILMIEAYEKSCGLGIRQARTELGRLGEEYFNSGRYDDSIAANLALSRLEPKEYQHYHNLSVVYNKTGNKTEALKYNLKALEFVPPDKKQIVEKFGQDLK